MSTKKATRINPVFWGLLLFILAQVLILLIVPRIDPFLNENNIFVPSQPPQIIAWWPGEVTLPSGEIIDVPAQSALGPILIYILASASVLALTLALIPFSVLRILIRLLFAFLFSWGAFIATVFFLPLPLSIAIAFLFGIFWFITPTVWLHNLALILALTSLGAVFGRLVTPWTVMVLILLLAIYDFLAVRLGFMLWMANSLSKVAALPAIIIPKDYTEWRLNLGKQGGRSLVEENPADREFSILGGGDIAFPCLLTASIYFAHGLGAAASIAIFGLLGLGSAYAIQATLLKGRPIPALPPIAAATLVGLLIIT